MDEAMEPAIRSSGVPGWANTKQIGGWAEILPALDVAAWRVWSRQATVFLEPSYSLLRFYFHG